MGKPIAINTSRARGGGSSPRWRRKAVTVPRSPPLALAFILDGTPGPRRRNEPGWSVRRCATGCIVTMRRGLRAAIEPRSGMPPR